eukprot:5015064-Alexandrium_andersonii.AAC.1
MRSGMRARPMLSGMPPCASSMAPAGSLSTRSSTGWRSRDRWKAMPGSPRARRRGMGATSAAPRRGVRPSPPTRRGPR